MNNQKQNRKKGPKKAPQQKKKNGSSQSGGPAFGPAQQAPVASARAFRVQKPVIEYARDGSSCRIQHCERVTTILGSVAFTVNTVAVNPGLSASFPWLSNIARRFEAYRFRNLRFHYRTKCATSFVGDVIQTLDYDAADGAPGGSVQAEAYQGAVSCAPWQDSDMVSSSQNLSKFPQRYVRGSPLAANLDIKTYDVGNLFVCTENQASAALVGYLYVSYDVDFFTPQLNFDDTVSGAMITAGGTESAANPLGDAPVLDAQASGVSVSATSVVTFANPGTYLVAWRAVGTVLSALTGTAGAGATVTASTAVFDGAAVTGFNSFVVVTTLASATVAFTATATTITSGVLRVATAPAGSLLP